MKLIEQIQEYLKTNHITQKDFAEKVGISVGTLQSWLHKGIKPRGEVMRKLAIAMDMDMVSMAYLNVDKSKCDTTIGYYLSLVRNSLGITAKDMGTVLDISQAAYSKWETGENQPQPRHIPRIADTLDIDIDMAFNWAYTTKATDVAYAVVSNSHDALVDRFQSVGRVM